MIKFNLKSYFFPLLCVLLFCFNLDVRAENDTELLRQYFTKLQSLSAQFYQTLYTESGEIMQQVHGKIALQKPNYFYWQTPVPHQLIVADGRKLWIYDQDLDQVLVKPLAASIQQSPATLLLGDGSSLSRNYRVKAIATHSTMTFLLTPKNKQQNFAQIKLVFVNNQIMQLELKDILGQRTQLEFMQVKTNLALNPKLFQFTPPPNVDVIQ